MEPFYFKPKPVYFIRDAMSDKTELEVMDAEQEFYAYLDIALRVFKAEDAKVAKPPKA